MFEQMKIKTLSKTTTVLLPAPIVQNAKWPKTKSDWMKDTNQFWDRKHIQMLLTFFSFKHQNDHLHPISVSEIGQLFYAHLKSKYKIL